MSATLALCAHLAVMVLTSLVTNTLGAPITCEAGTYTVGKPASVTCNFHTDVLASERSFNMTRYPSDPDEGAIGTDVLVCTWLVDLKKHDCHVSAGYTFNDVISDRVTVGIPNATDSYKGLYMCFFDPTDRSENACEFFAKDKSSDTPTKEQKKSKSDADKGMEIGIAVAIIIVLILTSCVLCYLCTNDKIKTSTDGADQCLIPLKDKQVKKRLKSLKLSKQLTKVMGVVQQAVHSGLDRATGQETDTTDPSEEDMKMYQISCPLLDQQAVDDYLVVDFGSRRLKISDVRFSEQGIMKIPSKSYPLKPEIRTCDQLFHFIIESMDSFVREKIPDAETRNAVLIVPFPCEHTCVDNATLVSWTREFTCEGVENEDLSELLQKALNSRDIGKKPCKVKFVAIVNDVVSTVMSVAYQNPDCRIGMVVGSGFNACYVETWGRVADGSSEDHVNMEIYNTMVGAIGEKGCLEEYRSDYDRALDTSSRAPENQTLEKMVSWTYIGELVRLVLKDLRTDELLLESVPLSSKLFQKGCLTADHVAEIDSETEIKIQSDEEGKSDEKTTTEATENGDVPGHTGAEEHTATKGNNDEEKPHPETERILRELGADQFTEEDVNTVRNVCRLVIDRAAHLAGAVLASLLNRLCLPSVVVVVDGELYRKVPRFHGLLYKTTNRLVQPELKDNFYLVTSYGRGNVGAARIAAAYLRQEQAADTSQSQEDTEK